MSEIESPNQIPRVDSHHPIDFETQSGSVHLQVHLRHVRGIAIGTVVALALTALGSWIFVTVKK